MTSQVTSLIDETSCPCTLFISAKINEMLCSSMFHSFSTIGMGLDKMKEQTLGACRKKI
jgi:hypothetical protein